MTDNIIIKMENTHGLDNSNAWYQKVGTGCFQFVTDRNLASVLTVEEAIRVLKHEDWYCKMFNAKRLIIEEVSA